MSNRAEAAFSVASSWETMRTACSVAGFDASDARLMRFGENALFHLPADAVVVRIARTMDYWSDAAKEVNVAHWLAGHHLPAAEVCDTAQPVEIDGRPVTFWRFIDGRFGDQRASARAACSLLRLWHRRWRSVPTTFDMLLCQRGSRRA